MSDNVKLAASGVVTSGSGISGYLDVISVVISGVGVLSGIIFGCITAYSVIQGVIKDRKISKNDKSIERQGQEINELKELIEKMSYVPGQNELRDDMPRNND